jgi:hypothetical protein
MEQAILAIGIPAVIGTGMLFLWVCLDIWRWMRRPDDDQTELPLKHLEPSAPRPAQQRRES